jgi:hypothetical protein
MRNQLIKYLGLLIHLLLIEGQPILKRIKLSPQLNNLRLNLIKLILNISLIPPLITLARPNNLIDVFLHEFQLRQSIIDFAYGVLDVGFH